MGGTYEIIKMGFVPMVIILCGYICIFICMKLELYKYFEKTEAEKQESIEEAKRAFSGAPEIMLNNVQVVPWKLWNSLNEEFCSENGEK